MKNTCLFCALKTMFVFSSFCGVTCFTFKCSHNGRDTFTILPSLTYQIFSMLVAGTIFMGFILMIYEEVLLNEVKDPIHLLQIFVEFLSGVLTSIIIVTRCFTKLHDHMSMYEHLMMLIRNERHFGMNGLLKESFVRSLRWQCFAYVTSAFLSSIIYTAIYRKYLYFFVFYSYIIYTGILNNDIKIHAEIYANAYEQLKNKLSQNLNAPHDVYTLPLIVFIKKFIHLHSYMSVSFKLCTSANGVTVALGIILSIVIFIIYTYIMILTILFGTDGVVNNLLLTVGMQLYIVLQQMWDFYNVEQLKLIVSTSRYLNIFFFPHSGLLLQYGNIWMRGHPFFHISLHFPYSFPCTIWSTGYTIFPRENETAKNCKVANSHMRNTCF